ncbi:MAG: hypothetical protein EA402_13895 [Planctomycetota bacterium]|nr:MAG: hypothetical protein EA402_13895 [Planctomycetota bacterium]
MFIGLLGAAFLAFLAPSMAGEPADPAPSQHGLDEEALEGDGSKVQTAGAYTYLRLGPRDETEIVLSLPKADQAGSVRGVEADCACVQVLSPLPME